MLLPLTGSDTARGERTATCLPELLPSTESDTARGEQTATCLPDLPVATLNGNRHGSRRTDGHVSPWSPCCYPQRESIRLAENGRPRVSLLLPSTGSDTARGEQTATCLPDLPVATLNGNRHGSRRTDGHVSPWSPCCYPQREATRLAENGRPRVSPLLPLTGSSCRARPEFPTSIR